MTANKLPPGQKASSIFPRFGLSQYANRFPTNINDIKFEVGGECELVVSNKDFLSLPQIQQTSDFHCVTTWSKQSVNWEGVRFKDFYDTFISPVIANPATLKFVVLKAQDGYKTGLYLEDLLKENVLLANKLNGESLGIAHGAPLRIVAPAQYGYKNLKHLYRMEFYNEVVQVKQGYLSFMDHPRARVAREERASGGPGWFFRYLYRPLISSTVKEFQQALEKHERKKLAP